jgi:ParB/RepB/Spo0J family partition protein
MELKGEVKKVLIDDVVPNSFNPKLPVEESQENAERYRAIVEGIKKWGMFEAIIVRQAGGKYEIIDGYHRWRACKELGYVEVLINDLGNEISDEVAKKINILKEKARVPLDMILSLRVIEGLAQGADVEELAKELGYQRQKLLEDLEVARFDWNHYHSGPVEIEGKGNEGENVVEIRATNEEIEVIKDLVAKSVRVGVEDVEIARLMRVDRIIMTKEQKKVLFDAIGKFLVKHSEVKGKGAALEGLCSDYLARA